MSVTRQAQFTALIWVEKVRERKGTPYYKYIWLCQGNNSSSPSQDLEHRVQDSASRDGKTPISKTSDSGTKQSLTREGFGQEPDETVCGNREFYAVISRR